MTEGTHEEAALGARGAAGIVARASLIGAVFATGIEVIIVVAFGVMAGFFRGKVDTFISRMMDVVLSLPVLLLALGLVSACGLQPEGCLGGLIKPGLLLVSYVIGLFSWPYLARIVRGQVLSLREKEFVESARSMGAGNVRIMFKEILPNLIAPIVVDTPPRRPSTWSGTASGTRSIPEANQLRTDGRGGANGRRRRRRPTRNSLRPRSSLWNAGRCAANGRPARTRGGAKQSK